MKDISIPKDLDEWKVQEHTIYSDGGILADIDLKEIYTYKFNLGAVTIDDSIPNTRIVTIEFYNTAKSPEPGFEEAAEEFNEGRITKAFPNSINMEDAMPTITSWAEKVISKILPPLTELNVI